MLTITVELSDNWNSEKNEFETESYVLQLEHSLASLSKWESEFEKPFLSKEEKTEKELRGYLRAMVLTPVYPLEVFEKVSNENLEEINRYIKRDNSATTFREQQQQKNSNEQITSELIYYWLTAYRIPWEAQYWNLNRLFNLIRILNIKNEPPKKTSPKNAAAQRRMLNEQRRQQLGSSG